ncbi:hypothetical protein HanPSC8_Chr12g0538421 [Helianthus annuus]|nr:hypothetical protein HanPSC8_Chr12g0538421 [Helianthus annuus]
MCFSNTHHAPRQFWQPLCFLVVHIETCWRRILIVRQSGLQPSTLLHRDA